MTIDAATTALIPDRRAADDDVYLSPRQLAWRRARRHPGLLFGLTVVVLVTLVAVLAGVIAPHDPYEQDLSQQFAPTVWQEGGSWINIFGTDSLGRDVFSRLLYGARISLIIAFFAASVAAVIGTAIGVIGGYFGGRIDAVIMYLISCKLSLPGLIVSLSLVSVFGSSPVVLVLVIAFLFWDRYAIVTRTVTMQLREREFVTAARALGSSHSRIIISEILPNLLNHIIVVLTLEMAVAILVEAALSFLGLGIQPPTPSWGNMVSEGRADMFFQPHLVAIPGLAIFLLVISINLLGDGLRDVTAPDGRN